MTEGLTVHTPVGHAEPRKHVSPRAVATDAHPLRGASPAWFSHTPQPWGGLRGVLDQYHHHEPNMSQSIAASSRSWAIESDLFLHGKSLVRGILCRPAHVQALAVVGVSIGIGKVPVLRPRHQLARWYGSEVSAPLRRVRGLGLEARRAQQLLRVPRLAPLDRCAAGERQCYDEREHHDVPVDLHLLLLSVTSRALCCPHVSLNALSFSPSTTIRRLARAPG